MLKKILVILNWCTAHPSEVHLSGAVVSWAQFFCKKLLFSHWIKLTESSFWAHAQSLENFEKVNWVYFSMYLNRKDIIVVGVFSVFFFSLFRLFCVCMFNLYFYFCILLPILHSLCVWIFHCYSRTIPCWEVPLLSSYWLYFHALIFVTAWKCSISHSCRLPLLVCAYVVNTHFIAVHPFKAPRIQASPVDDWILLFTYDQILSASISVVWNIKVLQLSWKNKT